MLSVEQVIVGFRGFLKLLQVRIEVKPICNTVNQHETRVCTKRIQLYAWKCEQLFAERGKFDYTRCAKYAVVAYKNVTAVLKAKDGLAFTYVFL
jgi:hypothetical protein